MLYGTSQYTSLLAVDTEILFFGVAKEISNETITTYAKNHGVQLLNSELLTKWPQARSNTFKLTMRPRYAETALKESTWPHGVGVRRFKRKKGTPNKVSYKEPRQKNDVPIQHVRSVDTTFSAFDDQSITYPNDLTLNNRYQLP